MVEAAEGVRYLMEGLAPVRVDVAASAGIDPARRMPGARQRGREVAVPAQSAAGWDAQGDRDADGTVLQTVRHCKDF